MQTTTKEQSKKAAHTPGPWHYHAVLSGSENHRGFRILGLGRSGWSLAAVAPFDSDGVQGEANARLIAAAPELLEALTRLMELERRDRLMPIGSEWDAARAAIAKAGA